MRSESIGPYLVVADGSGTIVAENYDGADMAGFDSRIETTLETGSTYTIWATSWQGERDGRVHAHARPGVGSRRPGDPACGHFGRRRPVAGRISTDLTRSIP